MQNQNTSKLKLLFNFSNNILHQKKLIIWIGSKGVTINIFNKHQLIENIFIGSENQNDLDYYISSFNKYKNYNITFLLDGKNCKLKHEIMPILQSLIKKNLIDDFITNNYGYGDIVAYNIYNIDYNLGEVLECTIASANYSEPINILLEYIIKNKFKLGGIYFLCLEFGSIIDELLKEYGDFESQSYIHFFVVVTRTSDIRIVVKYNDNIMHEVRVDYPVDKSDLYLGGTIQQTISDKLLLFKGYIAKLNLKTCLIFLCDEDLEKILNDIDFKTDKKIIISNLNVKKSNSTISDNSRFQDNNLLAIFSRTSTFLALNQTLKSILSLTLLNNIIFKPLMILSLGLSIMLGFLKYQTIHLQNKTYELNKEYYLLSSQYRKIKKQYPQLENITNLAHLHHLESIINIPSPTPLKMCKTLFSLTSSDIKIKKINWKMIDLPEVPFEEKRIILSLDLTFSNKANEISLGFNSLNQYIDRLRSVFSDFEINYETNDINKVINLPHKIVIIPVNVIITGRIGNSTYAR